MGSWLLFPGAVLVIGTAVISTSLWQLLAGLESNDWPCVEGVIAESAIVEGAFAGGELGSPSAAADRSTVAISYRYAVGDQVFIGKRLHFGYTAISPEQLNREYPRGAKIQVHYNPKNPKDAVLEPGVTIGAVVGIVMGAIFIAFGVASLRAALRTS
jgi:Protein of unknown function (DUF3592)